jgi:ADP-ribose pyrophosphatase YjhB (NUDIX family)
MQKNYQETHSAGGVVINNEDKVLVVDQNGTSWSLPKGHIEEGENVLEAAKREIEEESGITQLEYVRDLGEYERHMIGKNGGEDKSVYKKITMFLFRTNQQNLKPLDSDNQEALWVSKDEVTDLLTHQKDKEFFLSIKDSLD